MVAKPLSSNRRLFLPLLPIREQQFSSSVLRSDSLPTDLGVLDIPPPLSTSMFPSCRYFAVCLPCCFLAALLPWDCHLSPGRLSFPPYTTRQCLVSGLWVISPLGSKVSSQSLLLVLIPRGSNTGLVRLAGSWLFIFLVPSCKKSDDGSHMCAFDQRNRTTSQRFVNFRANTLGIS